MIPVLAPVRKLAAARSNAVNPNITLTLNDGTVARPRLSDGGWRLLRPTKPIRAGPDPAPPSMKL